MISQLLSMSSSWFTKDSRLSQSAQLQFLRKCLKFALYDLSHSEASHLLRWYLKTIFTEDNLDLK